MADRTTFVEVADGDQLSEGYFNEIGALYIETTEDSGSDIDIANPGASNALIKTFVFTAPESGFVPTSIYLKDFTATADGDGGTIGLGFDIYDGTNYYTANPLDTDATPLKPPRWYLGERPINNNFLSVASSSAETLDAATFPLPVTLLAENTAWTIRFRLNSSTAAGSTTIDKGFIIGMGVSRVRTVRGSVSQS